MAQELTKEKFDVEIKNGKGVALVDFWAPWCGPCRKQVPIVDELAESMDSKAKIAKVNVDEEQDLASEFQIISIPTLILFKDGEVVERLSGLHSKEQLTSILEKTLKK